MIVTLRNTKITIKVGFGATVLEDISMALDVVRAFLQQECLTVFTASNYPL